MIEITGIREIVKPENLAYRKSVLLTDNIMSYCPGCGHGTVHRILAEVIDEEGLQSADNWCIAGWMFCSDV